MKNNELITEIFERYEAGCVTDEELVQIIELAVTYLNLKTTTNTAKFRQKSYNGIKNNNSPAITIDGLKFYKNND